MKKIILPFLLLFSSNFLISNDVAYSAMTKNTTVNLQDMVSSDEILQIVNKVIDKNILKSNSQWAKGAITTPGNKWTSSIDALKTLTKENIHISEEDHDQRSKIFYKTIKKYSKTEQKQKSEKILALMNGLFIDMTLYRVLNDFDNIKGLSLSALFNEVANEVFSGLRIGCLLSIVYDAMPTRPNRFHVFRDCFKHDWNCYLNQFNFIPSGHRKDGNELKSCIDTIDEQMRATVATKETNRYLKETLLPELDIVEKAVSVTLNNTVLHVMYSDYLTHDAILIINNNVHKYIAEHFSFMKVKTYFNRDIINGIIYNLDDVSRCRDFLAYVTDTKDGWFRIILQNSQQQISPKDIKNFDKKIVTDFKDIEPDINKIKGYEFLLKELQEKHCTVPKTEEDKNKFLEEELTKKAQILGFTPGEIKLVPNANIPFPILDSEVYEPSQMQFKNGFSIAIKCKNGQFKTLNMDDFGDKAWVLLQYLKLLEQNDFEQISDYWFDYLARRVNFVCEHTKKCQFAKVVCWYINKSKPWDFIKSCIYHEHPKSAIKKTENCKSLCNELNENKDRIRSDLANKLDAKIKDFCLNKLNIHYDDLSCEFVYHSSCDWETYINRGFYFNIHFRNVGEKTSDELLALCKKIELLREEVYKYFGYSCDIFFEKVFFE